MPAGGELMNRLEVMERFYRVVRYGTSADIGRAMRDVTRELRQARVVVQFPSRPRQPVQPPADLPPAA